MRYATGALRNLAVDDRGRRTLLSNQVLGGGGWRGRVLPVLARVGRCEGVPVCADRMGNAAHVEGGSGWARVVSTVRGRGRAGEGGKGG